MVRRRCKLSGYQQNKLLEMFVAGVPARTSAELTGINRHSATLFYQKIREMIFYELEDESPFDGEVEVDESYFGGHRKGNRGRGAAGKVPVFGILKRGGKVYTKVIPDASSDTLIPIITRKVVVDSIVYTDSWRAYNALSMLAISTINVSTTVLNTLMVEIAATTLTASKTFGARPSAICASIMASLNTSSLSS